MSENKRPSKTDIYFGTQNRAIVTVVLITVVICLAVIFSQQILDFAFKLFMIVFFWVVIRACLEGKFGKSRK